ncbi:MAG: hypothetical protein INH37_26300, partial [Myxococcaceae bacterium]|nr:hypothetical protein [Myxococcaceae bacterium]
MTSSMLGASGRAPRCDEGDEAEGGGTGLATTGAPGADIMLKPEGGRSNPEVELPAAAATIAGGRSNPEVEFPAAAATIAGGRSNPEVEFP